MKFLNLVLIIFSCHFVRGVSNLTLCIDGGGSKTLLQIVDQQAHVISFAKNGSVTDKAETGGSNINTVGEEGLRACIRELFGGVEIDGKALMTLLPECNVIAGMAGISTDELKDAVAKIFQEYGIAPDKITLFSDAELNLQLIDRDGIMLIAGTGSICLGKKNQKLYRVGGLGRTLGDEGSGYFIGLQAVKAALAQEYGWGQPTTLTGALREFFNTVELKRIIGPITLHEITAARIAKIAPLVFEHAHAHDAVAQAIVEQAAQELGLLITRMLNLTGLNEADVQLWGGVFKGEHADSFIKKIEEHIVGHPQLINRAHQNPVVLAAQNIIRKK